MNATIFKDSEDFELKRKRQIDTLKVFNDNVQEIQPGTDYRVEFWAGSRRMAILIHLGPDFPLESPVLCVSPSVSHAWVDHCGRITAAPGLLNFTQHSDLGRVVHAIVREFELRPPAWIGPETAASTSESNSPIETVGQASSPSSHIPQNRHLEQMMFPELSELPTAELKLLLESADHRNEFLERQPAYRMVDEQIEKLISSAEKTAKENLAKREELQEAREACEERRRQLNELHQSYEALSLKFQSLADRRTPASIRESLRAATHQADEASEHVAEKFLSGEMNVDQFLVAYIDKRMMSHLRRVKEEKLSQQLRDLLRAGY